MPSKFTMVSIGAFFLAVLVWASWFFRFDLHIVPNPDGYDVAYRLDRWNGNLRFIEEDQWYPVVEGNPKELHESFNSQGSSL